MGRRRERNYIPQKKVISALGNATQQNNKSIPQ
jgi:hypothetical protein